MKRIISLIVLALMSTAAIGQITLSNSFNCQSLSFAGFNTKSFIIAPDENTIDIYNEDCVLEKRVTGLPTFDYIPFLSKNVFTLSGKYEFVLAFLNSTASRYEFRLYNEDGQLLFDFGEYSPSVFKGNKLIAYCSSSNGNQVKIYNVAGSINLTSTEDINSKLLIYPNPASSMINIQYSVSSMQEMAIRDINGRVIENILLDPGQKEIGLNVSGWAKGVYIYSYGGSTGKFIVQ
ncbi:MAG: T9SS type A sorting domain-containing protein [Bacteroidales bacterium]